MFLSPTCAPDSRGAEWCRLVWVISTYVANKLLDSFETMSKLSRRGERGVNETAEEHTGIRQSERDENGPKNCGRRLPGALTVGRAAASMSANLPCARASLEVSRVRVCLHHLSLILHLGIVICTLYDARKSICRRLCKCIPPASRLSINMRCPRCDLSLTIPLPFRFGTLSPELTVRTHSPGYKRATLSAANAGFLGGHPTRLLVRRQIV